MNNPIHHNELLAIATEMATELKCTLVENRIGKPQTLHINDLVRRFERLMMRAGSVKTQVESGKPQV